MKKIIFFSVFIFYVISDLQGQTFALLTDAKNEDASYSLSSFAANRFHRRPPNALMIVGGSIAGIGCFVAGYGALIVAFDYNDMANMVQQSESDRGHRYEIIGAILVASGVGMLIAGGVRQSKHRNKLGIVAPAKNEIGIAYTFRYH